MQMWWISFVGAACLVITCAVSLPTTTDGTPAVPREFPNFNQNYTFVDNSSIRENLASHSDVDTEVEDLLAKDEDGEPVEQEEEEVPNPSEQDEDVGKKSVVEWIENGDDTEDNKFAAERNQNLITDEPVEITIKAETTASEAKTNAEKRIIGENKVMGSEIITPVIQTAQSETTTEKIIAAENEVTESNSVAPQTNTEKSKNGSLEPYEDGVAVINGSVAGILVGLFLILCIFGYTALILWRRSLELKYGSREMLVDKDDIFDPDDMKHFSI